MSSRVLTCLPTWHPWADANRDMTDGVDEWPIVITLTRQNDSRRLDWGRSLDEKVVLEWWWCAKWRRRIRVGKGLFDYSEASCGHGANTSSPRIGDTALSQCVREHRKKDCILLSPSTIASFYLLKWVWQCGNCASIFMYPPTISFAADDDAAVVVVFL